MFFFFKKEKEYVLDEQAKRSEITVFVWESDDK